MKTYLVLLPFLLSSLSCITKETKTYRTPQNYVKMNVQLDASTALTSLNLQGETPVSWRVSYDCISKKKGSFSNQEANKEAGKDDIFMGDICSFRLDSISFDHHDFKRASHLSLWDEKAAADKKVSQIFFMTEDKSQGLYATVQEMAVKVNTKNKDIKYKLDAVFTADKLTDEIKKLGL